MGSTGARRRPQKYPEEMRDRAVGMVLEIREQTGEKLEMTADLRFRDGRTRTRTADLLRVARRARMGPAWAQPVGTSFASATSASPCHTDGTEVTELTFGL